MSMNTPIAISGISTAYHAMFNDTAFSDLQIQFKGSNTVLYVHRNILAYHSEVIRAMLLTRMKESLTSTITIEDDDEELFTNMIRSFYTGMIEIPEHRIAALAELADKYRANVVENKCFEYLTDNMNITNCLPCLFLDVEGNKQFDNLRETAYRFIGLHFMALSGSDTFLMLDVKTTAFILSREDLFVENEDKILSFLLDWVEVNVQERLQHLPLLLSESVRLHHVSARSLYDLYNKKYIENNNALLRLVTEATIIKHSLSQHERFSTPSIAYQKPREGATHYFDSVLINAEQQLQLREWYDQDNITRKKWILCYRASRDGYEARQFHTHCDNRGETITIIKSRIDNLDDLEPSSPLDQKARFSPGGGAEGYVFGGYTSKSWASPPNEEYIYDDKAWLFSLTNPSNHDPIKLRVHANKFAICNHINFGPRWGDGSNSFDGRDVCIQSNCGMRSDNYTNPGKSYALPTGYHFNSTAAKRFFTGHEKFVVRDMEVFYSVNIK